MSDKAYLILADGQVFEGRSVGVKGTVIGEVVFTTGMTAYQETMTDASYFGQIVTQTFPLIGNYGLNDEDYESDKPYIKGYIVREWCKNPSNFRMKYNLDEFMKAQNIIGICGIDTRKLTRTIREHGVMNGAITDNIENKDELLKDIAKYRIENAVETVSTDKIIEYKAQDSKYKVALIDYGYKYHIRRALLSRGCDITIFPAHVTADELRGFDGIMLSNGPGDPKSNKQIIENLKQMIKLNIPIFGICLGHQLMALCMGGDTEKLKYGHRGANQPVVDVDSGQTYVTSQNHGYAVISSSIPEDIGYVSHKNANDGTCEGIKYKAFPCFTVQFHPEACGGPHDTTYLFDNFVSMIKAYKEAK